MTELPTTLIVMLGLSMLISSSGFYRLVYFVSIGYAFSVTAMAIALGVIFRADLPPLCAAHGVALCVYGLRLGFFLISRERQPSYKRETMEVEQRAAGVTPVKKVLIWIGVSVLYVLMVTPYLFNLQSAHLSISLWSLPYGLALIALGLSLEASADWQKSAFKRRFPESFCNIGLFRWVRCPSYLGEIIFWVGSWLAGVSAFDHWGHWVASLVGLVCIVLIMIGSTKRLEKKQAERYGELENYQKYIRTVPVLFPFVPIYSLKNVKVYLE